VKNRLVVKFQRMSSAHGRAVYGPWAMWGKIPDMPALSLLTTQRFSSYAIQTKQEANTNTKQVTRDKGIAFCQFRYYVVHVLRPTSPAPAPTQCECEM
jgi:hypothetical protein